MSINGSPLLQVSSIIERERTALTVLLDAEFAEPESCFIDQALRLLSEREDKLAAAYDGQLHPAQQDKLLGPQDTSREVAATTSEASINTASIAVAAEGVFPLQQQESPVPTALSRSQKKRMRKKKSDFSKESDRQKESNMQSNGNKFVYESIFELPRDKSPDIEGNMAAVFSDDEMTATLGVCRSNTSSSVPSDVTSSVRILELGTSVASSYDIDQLSNCDQPESMIPSESLRKLQLSTDVNAESLQFVLEEDLVVDPCTATEDASLRKSISSPAGICKIFADNSNCGGNKTFSSSDDSSLNTTGGNSSDNIKNSKANNITTARCGSGGSSGGNCNNPGKSTYHFYQAADGSHVYLHPLNMAMLTAHYGQVEHCPTSIQAAIVEKVIDPRF